jgi:NitT/TauT family transport system substrate-binding protein
MERRSRMPAIVVVTVSVVMATAIPAAVPAPGPQPIRVAIPAYNMSLSPVFLADTNGYYKRHGLSATVVQLNGSTVTSAALESGNIDFEVTGAAPFLLSVATGLPFIAVAVINRGFTSQVVVSTRYLATHPIPAGATLGRRAAVIRDATMGMVSTTDIATAKYLLQFADPPAAEFRPVKMRDQEGAIAALQSGDVDVVILSPPQSFQAEAQGFGKVILNTRDVPGLGTVPYDVAATTRAYAQAHPDVVHAFLAALEEALADVAGRSPRVLDFERSRYPTLPLAVIKRTLDFLRLTPYQPMKAEQWRGLEKFMSLGGQLKTPYTMEEDRDWTNRFMPARPR